MPTSPPHRIAIGSDQYREIKEKSRQHGRRRLCYRAIAGALAVGIFQLGIVGGMILSKGKTETAAPVHKVPLPPRMEQRSQKQLAATASAIERENIQSLQDRAREKAPNEAKKIAKQVQGIQLVGKRVSGTPRAVEPREARFRVYDDKTSEYAAGIINRVNRYRQYPDSARKAGVEGRCILVCIVRRNGSVVHTEVVRSSGKPALDQAAVRAVARVGLFPPVPETIKGEEVSINIPVLFRLSAP